MFKGYFRTLELLTFFTEKIQENTYSKSQYYLQNELIRNYLT